MKYVLVDLQIGNHQSTHANFSWAKETCISGVIETAMHFVKKTVVCYIIRFLH